MSETSTEKRDQINQSLQWETENAIIELGKVQKATAERLTEGGLLDWSDLERIAQAQARADIWMKVRRVRNAWEAGTANAPEPADLVEAVHEVRGEVVRDLMNFQGGQSTSGMSNELERAKQIERREFVRRTAMIYSAGSPLRKLGRW